METTAMAEALRWALAGASHALPAAFRGFSQMAAPLAVTALWQGAALACGLALCMRLAPRASAAHRFLLWSAGFAALVSLPFLPLLLNSTDQASSAAGGFSAGVTATAAKPWLQLDLCWSLVVGALWVAASALRAVDLGVHSLRLRRLWKGAVPVEACSPTLSPEKRQKDGARSFGGARGLIGLRGRRRVEVCTTKELDRPSVIGFFAPRILIPEWLYARLTREELDQVVLHEAEHLRRRDDWTNLLQKLCLVVFPLNPALAWMERRLCREREMACDDGVVRATQAPRAYAACLTSLAERGLQRRAEALSLGAWQRRPELANRVHRILKRSPGLGPLATHALLGALACGLVLGSVEFARCPQLIAFVPEQHAQAARTAVAKGQQAAPARLRNAASGRNARRQDAEAVPMAVSGFRAVETAAVAPAGRAVRIAKAAETRIALERGAPLSADRPRESAAMAEVGTDAPRQVLLKAEMGEPEPGAGEMPQAKAERAHAEQWVVFAAWEQVEAPAQAAGVSAGQTSGEASNKPGGKAASRSTVTRLILRVYPASALSGLPAAVPTRNGWLIIEL
jgi:hypothetical protein